MPETKRADKGQAKAIDTPEQLPAYGYLRQSQLIPAILPFSGSTLWRKINSGEFPKPVKLSTRVTAWRVEDVRKWMESVDAANSQEVAHA